MRYLKNIANIYFIGVGGIGMSALARYFVQLGKKVGGYDKTPSAITRSLESLGVAVHFTDVLEDIPVLFMNKEDTLVIYTPAIPDSHLGLNYFKNHDFDILKRSEVLGALTKETFTLAVAGTHGKTTTTAILAYLLKESGVGVTAFLGGISENYHSNLVMEGTDVIVAEADEFDRSFLQLYPDIAAITSMDADHLDIYEKADALEDSFHDFASKVSTTLLVRGGLLLTGLTFGIEDESDYSAQRIRVENGTYVFDLKTPEELLEDLELTLPGRHNLTNAITAFAMARLFGVPSDTLAKILPGFRGVQRRFSYKVKTKNLVYIDDYAHHPTEINALYQAVQEMHAGKKVLAIFQPHLYSRTRDFAADFAKSLSQFDEVLLLDIYPARELPISGVTSEWLMSMMELEVKKRVDKNMLVESVLKTDAEVIVTIGAGDIGEEVTKITAALEKKIRSTVV